MTIDVGEGTKITGTFKDTDGTIVDPTTPVTIVVKDQADNLTEITATKDDTGVFSGDYTPSVAGIHYYTFYSNDNPPAIDQGNFLVKSVIAKKS